MKPVVSACAATPSWAAPQRPALDVSVELMTTVLVSLLFHAVLMLVYLTYGGSETTEFFSSTDDVKIAATVDLVKVPVQKPKPAQQVAAAPGPTTPRPTVAPPLSAPRPKPRRELPRPGRPALAPRPQPAAAPRVFDVPHTSERPVQVGHGGGVPGGTPNGRGAGGAPGGTGDGVPGGTANGGPGGGGGDSGILISCEVDYPNLANLGFREGQLTPDQIEATATVRSWQEFCKVVGIDYEGDLCKREEVKPVYRTFFQGRSARDMGRTHFGLRVAPEQVFEGEATLQIDVSAEGKATTYVQRPTGNETMDAFAYKLGTQMSTEWLPALRFGKPVAYTAVVPLRFSRAR